MLENFDLHSLPFLCNCITLLSLTKHCQPANDDVTFWQRVVSDVQPAQIWIDFVFNVMFYVPQDSGCAAAKGQKWWQESFWPEDQPCKLHSMLKALIFLLIM